MIEFTPKTEYKFYDSIFKFHYKYELSYEASNNAREGRIRD